MNPRPTAKELNIAKRKLQGFLSNELAQRTSRAIIVPYELKDQLQSPRIPNEILRAVLEYVDAITLARVSCACKLFFNIVLNGKYWHVLVDGLMDKLNIFPAWRALFNVNDTKKAIYATLHANSKFLKESCYILTWFASNQTGTLDQEINAKSALEKLFRTKYSTNPWKVSTIGREKFENDLTELKKYPPPSVHLQYDSNEPRPTLYIRIETSSENHLYPRQTVRFYIPVSDSYPRERPFVYCEPPIYHPFINQATGVVSLEEIEKHFQFVQNQVINNDSYVVRNLNSSLSLSGSTTPVSSPSKLSNSTSSIMNTSNNNTLAVEKIERLTASLEIEAKPTCAEICEENINTKINFEQQQQEVKILPTIIEHPPITITTTNTNQNNQNPPNTPSTPVSSSPHTPSTPSSSTSSTSNSSNFSSPFCSPYRSEGQNVLKSVVDALQNLFVDTSYLTNYMNF